MADAALSYESDDCRPSRGRPRDEEKNLAIMEAAVELFLQNGYDATSMEQVARRAGVSKQTVYSHFEGKEGLFAASVRSKIDEHKVQDALDQLDHHTLEADLTAVATTYGELLLSPEAVDMFRLLAAQAAKNGSDLAQRFWAAGPETMLEDLKSFLASWQDAGALEIENLEEAAVQMIALIKGGVHFKLSIGLIDSISEQQFKDHIASAVDMFLRRYRA